MIDPSEIDTAEAKLKTLVVMPTTPFLSNLRTELIVTAYINFDKNILSFARIPLVRIPLVDKASKGPSF
jgi:hypothetical protein